MPEEGLFQLKIPTFRFWLKIWSNDCQSMNCIQLIFFMISLEIDMDQFIFVFYK